MAPKSAISLEDLGSLVSARFEEAQSSLANHRKNCVALYKFHVQAAKVINKNGRLEGELAFGDTFIDMVNRVVVMKKGVCADRIVRFIGGYVKFVNDKVMEERQSQEQGTSASITARNTDEEETFAARFVSRLLEWIFQGFTAKNKTVRQRSVQVVSEMVSNIGEIDEDTYNNLRDNLIERICDKEPLIRAHAVVALSKLVGTEDPDELQEGESTILELLLEEVCYDTAAEVRRAALLNLPVTPETLPIIITRTRDVDTIARKMVYSSVLLTKLDHPRRLTIAQREEIVKAGLGDREPAVRVAAGALMTSWFDIAMGEPEPPDEQRSWEGDDGGVMKAFVRFLGFFDVVGPGEAVAVDAMLSVLTTRPNLADVFVFSDRFWEELTPESAVFTRVFVEHCFETKNETRLEAASLPVVTAFAFHIQEAYNALLSVLQDAELLGSADPDDEESEAREEELAKKEVVLGELLRIALKLDYMDEIGRRKVFSVVKDMLAHPQLPPGLIEHCLDILSHVLTSEREMIRIVVEIIIELRDDDNEEVILDDDHDGSRSDITQSTFSKRDKSIRRNKERGEMSPEERQQTDLTDLRCLTLCIGMLERVHGPFEDNSTLEGVLSDLIIPAVKRKELALREKGLVSLGLCCLIAKNMATNSFQLFLSQVQSAPEELKLKVLQVIFDLMVMYDKEFLGRSEEISHQIVTFLLQTLDSEESPAVQNVLCIGICKLLLSGQIADTRVLLSLIIAYVSPSTLDNSELKQCLSYFFPVYCYSSAVNQSRMQSVFVAAFDHISKVHEELEEDQQTISLHQAGLLLVDWTDPTKLIQIPGTKTPDCNAHADLAVDLLLALYDSDRDDESRKLFCQYLGQLQISHGSLDDRILLKLHILIDNLQDQCPLENPAVNKVFNRFKDRYRKLFGSRVEQLDPGRFVDEDFERFYDSIGMEVPEATPVEAEAPELPSTPVLQERHMNLPETAIRSSPESSPRSPRSPRRAPDVDDKQPSPRPDSPAEEPPSLHSTPVPVTPMKKGSKRSLPSPSKQQPASPARKRRAPVTRKSAASKKVAPQEPLVGKGIPGQRRRAVRKTRSKKNLPMTSASESEEAEDHHESAKAGAGRRRTRAAADVDPEQDSGEFSDI